MECERDPTVLRHFVPGVIKSLFATSAERTAARVGADIQHHLRVCTYDEETLDNSE
jgi:hypothetical protein